MLKSSLLVTDVFGAAGAAGRDGARRATPVRARWRTSVVGGRSATTTCGCADAAFRTFEARPPATGRSATTRPAALPKAGNTVIGPFWTTPVGSRKTDSEIAIPTANVATTVGEKSANTRLM
jgi:hypothetical protein